MRRAFLIGIAGLSMHVAEAGAQDHPDELLWGDTHLHSNLSVDAYFLGNRSADADTAYRFAKGEPVIHPYHRARVQLRTPLDFLAVTDHAELLGVPYRLMTVGDDRLTNTRLGVRLRQLASAGRGEDAFGLFVLAINAAGADKGEKPPKKLGALEALWWKLRSLVSVTDSAALARRWLSGDSTLLEDLNQEDIIRTSWEANI
ncbi:MAG: DUF3604 domain-containing protein, partial [Parvularculaceae bacterium]